MHRPDFFYGIRLHIPETWADHSIYRFAAPKSSQNAPDTPFLTSKIKEFHANLIVTRLSLASAQEFEHLFADANLFAQENQVPLDVIASGRGKYMGQQMLWQDTYKPHPTTQTSLYQRHIAFLNPWNDVVLCTFTGTQHDVEQMTQDMGVEL